MSTRLPTAACEARQLHPRMSESYYVVTVTRKTKFVAIIGYNKDWLIFPVMGWCSLRCPDDRAVRARAGLLPGYKHGEPRLGAS